MYLPIKTKVRIATVVFNYKKFYVTVVDDLIQNVKRKPTKVDTANVIADDWVRLRTLHNYSSATLKLFENSVANFAPASSRLYPIADSMSE
ncbi:MAG TPA: hypothetical protein PK108_15115 [Pyrinomonadaceae bacterium]|nr:hypothetical protein [Chloracidobacterium sp.]HRA41868.1 hypothetical protein [Pyrinomonadaceae bacterium]